MRPVQFIYNELKTMALNDVESSGMMERFRSHSFEVLFKEQYPYRSRDEELIKMFYELEHYKKVLEDTPFRCVYGEDGSLQYYHMCQECGNILHDPHDEWFVTEHDMMCPTCNGIDTAAYPYKTIPYGSMHWVHLVRSAEFTDKFNEEDPEHAGYVSGSAKSLAFRVTRWMAFKWWLYVQWSRIKSIANIIRHPRKHMEAIRNRNEWRKRMKEMPNDA